MFKSNKQSDVKSVVENVNQLGSPYWLIDSLQNLNEKVFQKVLNFFGTDRKFDILFFGAIVLVSYLLGLTQDELKSAVASDEYGYLSNYSKYLTIGIWFTCALAFFNCVNIRIARMKFPLSLLLFFVIKFFWYQEKSLYSLFWAELGFYLILIFYLLVLHLLFFKKGKYSAKFNMIFLICSFLGLLLFWWFFRDNFFSDDKLRKINFGVERYLFPIIIFWAEATNVLNSKAFFSYQRILQVFSPMNQMVALPMESDLFKVVSEEKRNIVRLQGLTDFFVGGLAGAAYYLIQRYFFDESMITDQGYSKIFTLGFYYYIMLFLKSFWAFRITTGIGRCLELNMFDGFNFALFAVNPMERWTRWSIYYYRCLRDFVFFPVMARSRSIFLALACTFFLSCCLHAFHYVYYIGMDSYLPYVFFRMRSIFVYYFLQMLTIYFCAKFMWIWPSGSKRVGWLGVLVTIGIMSVIHFLVWFTR